MIRRQIPWRILVPVAVGGLAAAVTLLTLHPFQVVLIVGVAFLLVLALRKTRAGILPNPQESVFYEVQQEGEGLIHLVAQARRRVTVEVVGDTARIVGSGVRELVKLPWSGVLRSLKVVNNVTTAVIEKAN